MGRRSAENTAPPPPIINTINHNISLYNLYNQNVVKVKAHGIQVSKHNEQYTIANTARGQRPAVAARATNVCWERRWEGGGFI